MGAIVDCEAIGEGLLRQPVNSVTALALVVAGGLILWRRPDRRLVGLAVTLTGVGSFLFHGPMPPGSEWAHDVSLAWLLVVVAASGTKWEAVSSLRAPVGLGVTFALLPGAGDPTGAVLAAVAVVALLRQDRSIASLGPLLLLGAAAVLGRLSATRGPLCRPDALFQGHGVWHLAAAAAVTWWALRSERAPLAQHQPSPSPRR